MNWQLIVHSDDKVCLRHKTGFEVRVVVPDRKDDPDAYPYLNLFTDDYEHHVNRLPVFLADVNDGPVYDCDWNGEGVL